MGGVDSAVADPGPRRHRGPRRPLAPATVLAVLLLLGAAAVVAWVVWQLADRTPAAFRDRPALPTCAPVVVPQGQTVPAAVRDCLTGADARRDGAEVRVTSLTTEGDPVTTYYRSLPGGGLEVFTDATEDSFGSAGWSHDRCPDVASWESGRGCRPA